LIGKLKPLNKYKILAQDALFQENFKFRKELGFCENTGCG